MRLRQLHHGIYHLYQIKQSYDSSFVIAKLGLNHDMHQ